MKAQSDTSYANFGISSHTVFRSHAQWIAPVEKRGKKEGGIIALVVMFASLILSIWVIIEHLNHVIGSVFTSGQPVHGGMVRPRSWNQSVWSWYLHDHITVMPLFVASFPLFPHQHI